MALRSGISFRELKDEYDPRDIATLERYLRDKGGNPGESEIGVPRYN